MIDLVPDNVISNPDVLAEWLARHPAQAQVMVERHHQLRLHVAREDVNEFIEYVGRDEQTGKRITQAPVHLSFQRLAEEHRRLIIWGHVESGKTNQIAILRTLWMLGRNPDLRIAIVCRSTRNAEKIVGAMQRYIESSEALHEVFPDLRPGKKWTDTAFTVAARRGFAKDFSVQAVGVGTTIQGSRLDIAILDDILDWENTRTDERRRQVIEWFGATIGGRLTEHSRVIIIGNAWHPDDFLHHMARNPAWRAFRFPVMDRSTGALRWPQRWSRARIDAWEREWGSAEAARQLYCEARDDAEARFKRSWIDQCLHRGEGRRMTPMLRALPLGYRTYTGVDVSTGEGNDYSCLFTICLHPSGDREVLCVETGKWSGPELVKRIIDTHERYFSIVAVESNATQKFITQFTGGAAPVKNFRTGANKMDPQFGVESIAVEMERGQWIIPSAGGRPHTREVESWIRGMLYYNPGAHTADELMACWIAREAACHRVGRVKSGTKTTLRR